MKQLSLSLLFMAFALAARAGDGGAIFGTWSLDPARSTDLAIWKSLTPRLVITGSAEAVTIRTLWMEGKNVRWADSVTVRPGGPPATQSASSAIWPDNWYMGVLTKVGSPQTTAAVWRTPGSGLDITSTRVVDVSQGEATITTARTMRVDSTGANLIVTDRRSARPTPVKLHFQRVILP